MRRALFALIAVFACAAAGKADTPVSGTISASTTWTAAASPYVMTGTVTVATGVTLTIEPGVTVKVGDTYTLDVYGTLTAVGNSTSPITFTSSSASPTAGAWGRIFFESGTGPSASRVSYASVLYGSYGDWAAVRVNGSSPQFDHLTISYSSTTGFWATGSASPTLDTVTLSNNATYGLALDAPAAATINNSTITNNGIYAISIWPNTSLMGLSGMAVSGNGSGGAGNAIEQRGGTITGSSALHTSSGVLPWIVTGNLTVGSGATLTIDAGVTVKTAVNCRLDIAGTLTAVGTAASPITFTSNAATPAPGQWAFYFEAGTGPSASHVSYASVLYASNGDQAAVHVNGSSPRFDHLTISYSSTAGFWATGSASPTLDTVTLSNNATYGLALDAPAAATINNATITNNGVYAISIWPNTSLMGLSGMTVSGNGSGGAGNAIEQRGGTITGSSALHTSSGVLPWIVTGNLTVGSGATLTIDAGVTVKTAVNCKVDIAGTLTAVGTAASPILFTSNAATPAPGQWALYFEAGTGPSASHISYASVLYASNGDLAAVHVNGSSPQFDHLTISYSSAAGFWATGSASPTLDTVTLSNNATYGLALDAPAAATINNSTITNNGVYAVSIWPNTTLMGLSGMTASGNGSGGAGNAVEQRGGTISGNTTLHASTIPWIVTGNLTVATAGVLSIDPGTTVKFAANVLLDVYGRLNAIGTSGSLITFTSSAASPGPGAWQSLYFEAGANPSASRVSYATVLYGSANDGAAIHVNGSSPQFDHITISYSSRAGFWATGSASPTLDTVTLSNNLTYGLALDAPAAATINNSTITNNSVYAISIWPDTSLIGLSGMTVSGNGSGGAGNGIEQRGGTITGNTALHGSGGVLPWIVTGNLVVGSTGTLTIDPGVTVKFPAGVDLEIAGRLTAVGTSASGITFTSASATPTAGAWPGIYIDPGAGPSASQLTWVTINYAGANLPGALTVDSSSPHLDHVTIASSSSAALYGNAAGAPVCVNCQFLTSASGVATSGTSAPDVRISWWGASSGPSGLGPGTGLSVAGAATQFEPWLTAVPTAVQYFASVSVLDRTFNPSIGTVATVRFTTSLSGNWSETIKDSSGRSVRTLSGSGTSGSPAWDGKNSHNSIQPNGTYTYDITSTATGGSAAPLHGRLIIDSTKLPVVSNAAVTPPNFSPNGDGVQDAATVTATVNFDDASWTARVKNSGGTVVRTVTLPAGGSLTFVWDGKNDSGVVQPDGTYTIACVATAGTASNTATVSVILDNTPPAVSITSPAAGTLSNIHQSGNASLSVIGSVTDIHLTNWTLDYGLGSNPPSWTVIATGTSAVVGGQLGIWNTFPLTNAGYTLRLQGWDSAGNRGISTAFYTVANFTLSQTTYTINTPAGQTQPITSVIPYAVNETLVIQNAAGTTIRTLFNGSRSGGSYTDTWDGRNDAGALVPDGAYFTSGTVSDATGSMVLSATGPYIDRTSPGFDYNYSAQSPTFDPFNNQPLGLTYSFTQPGKVTLFFTTVDHLNDPCAAPNYCLLRDVYQPSGTFTVWWSGVDDSGTLRTDLSEIGVSSIRIQLETNVTIAYGTVPSVSPVSVTPPFYGPAFGPQTIALDVSTYQNQTFTVAVAYRNQASGSVLRTVSQSGLAPGHVTLTWDGRSDDGQWVAPGIYIVTATVTDTIGNVVKQQILTNVSY